MRTRIFASEIYWPLVPLSQVNSVQEACAKCFAFTYQNLKSCKPHQKQNKKYKNAKSFGKKLKTEGLMFFVLFFSSDLQDLNFNTVFPRNLFFFKFNLGHSQRVLESKSDCYGKDRMFYASFAFCCFSTISSHFFAIYICIFHKTEVQTVILRCWTGLNHN